MTYPDDIFPLSNNRPSTLAMYAAERLDPGDDIEPDDKPAELATAFMDVCHRWFEPEVAKHGKGAVHEALVAIFTAYQDNR